jgi:hypothetical protein
MSEEEFNKDEFIESFTNGGWRETLDETLATDPNLEKFNGKPVGEIVKSYINLQKGYGDRVPKPKSSFSKKEWDEWNREYNTGYPKDIEEYEFGNIEDADERVPYSEEEEKLFKEIAHNNGLTVSQAQQVWQSMLKHNHDNYIASLDKVNSMHEEDKAKLKKEWGAAYEQKVETARAVLQKYGDEELLNSLKGTHINSSVLKLLANVGENFKEDKLETNSKPSNALTPVEAISKAKALQMKAVKAMHEGDRISAERFTSEATKYFEMAEA